ncbi:hypothetical protein CH063_15915, partial [Colletotrichum higginsianum]
MAALQSWDGSVALTQDSAAVMLVVAAVLAQPAGGLVPDVGAVDAVRVRLVQDVQGGEVLPDEAGLAGRAAGD